VNTIIPGGNGTPESRGVGRSNRAATAPADRRGASAPKGDASSSLQVSASGEQFAALRTRLERLDASRAEKVERLRELVASGRYKVDSEAIAEAMLADPATADALGMR
jgi:negative regulator of flagellin synthesis FlgM